MEEVSPYSVNVVFLAQLVIITIYSQCAAVKSTIRKATTRAAHTRANPRMCTRRHMFPHTCVSAHTL